MEDVNKFSHWFLTVLTSVLFYVCVVSFDARGHGFFRIMVQSFGVSAAFFVVCYACTLDEESRVTTDPPELNDHAKYLEKTDDDPWIAEFEMKYGKMPSKTVYTEYPSGAAFLGSAPFFPTFDELTNEQKEKMLKINEELNNGIQ